MDNVKQIIDTYKKSVQEKLGLQWLEMQWPEIDTSKSIQQLKQQMGEFAISVFELVNFIIKLQKEYKLSNLPISIIPWDSIKSGKSKEELEREMSELFSRIASDLDEVKDQEIPNISDLVNLMIIRYKNYDLGLFLAKEILERYKATHNNKSPQNMPDSKR